MIKHIITDIDGTLTPGIRKYSRSSWNYCSLSNKFIPLNNRIQTYKQFHCRDTEAAFLFHKYGVNVSILTSSRSNFYQVEEWAKEAQISNVMYTKGKDRAEVFKWLGEEIWPYIYFIGDSYIDSLIFDLDVGGFCPQDAASCLLTHPNVNILPQNGGNGVLMEAFLWLVKRNLI